MLYDDDVPVELTGRDVVGAWVIAAITVLALVLVGLVG
jgi:hypothetical protein